VTGRLDVSPDTAKSLVSTAQRLGELPAVEEGAAGGDLTYDRAVAVARLAEGGDGTTALEESAGLDVAGIHRQVAQRRRLSRHQQAFDDTYAWVRRNGDEILHLRLVPELDPAANESAGYFHVEDADSWHAAWTGGDVHLTAIEDHPSGMREFSFSDPNGNLIRVGHNL